MAKKKQSLRPAKDPDILERIREAILSGDYMETRHVKERAAERHLIASDYLYVLKTGNHEARKDKFDEMYNTWNYAVRGTDINERELRVIVSFDEDGLLIITVIDLDLEEDG